MNLNFTCEFNRSGQFDQGDVVADTKGSPVGMDGVFSGPDFNAGKFLGGSQANVVGAQINVEKDSGIGTI